MKQPPHTAALNRRLLALVRSGLWLTPPEQGDFGEGMVDWEALGDLAAAHTVAPLAAQGAMSLPDDQLPPREWIYRAFSFIERNRRTHRLVDSCVADAIDRLKEAGLSPVLLKGQAYAALYPQPSLRQCGDIDLHIGEADYLRACEASAALGWKPDDRTDIPGTKHYGCRLKGVRIELHRVAAQLPDRAARRRFDNWSRPQLASTHRTISIGGTETSVPPPIFDVVFVFLHLYHHFIRGGIGLRHLCDWVAVLHAHAATIDCRELEMRLKGFGLMRAWQLFGPIAVESLGLPEEEFPFYNTRHRDMSARILSLIMSEGNFGRHSRNRTPRPEGYWRGKLHTVIQLGRRMIPLIPVDPLTVTYSLGDIIAGGIANVFNQLRGRKS